MTIRAETFTSIPAEGLQTDQPVTSRDFASLAENLHVLYAVLRGQDLPGASCPLAPHDHGEGGGPPIPFVQIQPLGQPATARVTGHDLYVPFRRLTGGVAPALDLQRSASPDPVISSAIASTRTLLRLHGDVRAVLSGFDYVTLNDGINRGRYLTKALAYVSSVNATSLYLWDPLLQAPASGVAVKGWSTPGDPELRLLVPPWARRLTLFLSLYATLSLSTASGERLLATEAGGDAMWTQGARLKSGSVTGPWRRFHATGRRSLAMERLEMDCRSLADGSVRTFRVELACNDGLLSGAPVALMPEDYALWLRLPGASPNASAFAVFSR